MKIGLVSGSGNMVNIVYNELAKEHHNITIIDITKDKHSFFSNIISFESLDLDRFLKAIKENNITHIAFAGKIEKDRIIRELHIPLTREYADAEKGDINLLSLLQKILAQYGITVLDLRKYLVKYIIDKKAYTESVPSEKEWEDIFFGAKIAKALADLEIGQSIVVEDKIVYAVESIEGTNRCMLRAREYGLERGVLVKMGRTKQFFNLEIPVIGFETVKVALNSNIKTIALEAGTTLFIEREDAISFANKHNISIVGFSLEGAK